MSRYLYLALALAMGFACLWLVTDFKKRLNPLPDLLPPAPVIPPDVMPPKPSPMPDGVHYGKVNRVNGEQLDKIVKLQIPVLVKFGAEWCGPCNRIKPHLERFAVETGRNAENPADELLVLELEITEGRGPFERLRVRSLPTLVVFWGDECGRIEGVLTAGQIAKFAAKSLENVSHED